MNVSHCCGAETKIVHQSDHPFVYDDPYNLQIPVLVCTNCGKVVGLSQMRTDQNERSN